MDCVFDLLIDWHYHTQVHLGFLLCYLLGLFIALHFIFRSVIHLSQFLWKVWDLRLYSYFFFFMAYGCPVVPAPFVEKTTVHCTIAFVLVTLSKIYCYCSVAQSYPTLLRPHGLLHARLPCPWLFPGVCSNSCPLGQWKKRKWKSFSHVWLFVNPWTIQSMKFSRPEYWSV